jgi:5-methylcytosine-specific restriction endonuclease McrA
MSRREFSTKTRKEALKRSGYRCEASGSWYGLPEGQRCPARLAAGVEYDHLILDANSKDNSLENCRAVCPKCHRHKTSNVDVPTAAKTVRQQFMGLKTKVKAKIPTAPKAERPSKPRLAPRQIFEARQ